MSGHRQYKITDYRFGLMIVALREKTGLTQKQIGDALGVSRRTIQHWEAGTAFPDTSHLKNLIEYYLQRGSFTRGHEREEAEALWSQADESAVRRKTMFDAAWFDSLLHSAASTPMQAVVQPISEGPAPSTRIDWGDAPDIMQIVGRENELAELHHWVIDEHCRLVTVLGMGGIGKTTLVVRFAQEFAGHFEYIIWRSLRNAPALQDLLRECFQILSPVQPSRPSIQLLLELLQQHRCLLILDNVETLHRAGNLSGVYLEGFEEYQRMFQSIAQTRHQSCLLLTSRERPLELEVIEGLQSPVRVMKVAGLTSSASQALLSDKGLFGPSGAWDVFVHYYTGNPLALKIAAVTVRDLFGGDLAAFLREAPVTLHTLNQLLGNQFEHLSGLERDILFWLAIERDPVDLNTLRRNFLLDLPNQEILSGLLSLLQRSLIERSDQGAVFFLLPVLLEFVTDRLVASVVEQVIQRNSDLIIKYALLKSQSIDHIRDGQVRMILEPVLSLLKRHFGSQSALSAHLRQFIPEIRKLPREGQGYAGGNLVNLLSHLNMHIREGDFSGLVLRQVSLQGVEAQDSNFSGSEFIDSRFTEPLETISAMTMSPSGKYMAASTYNGHIRVWNVADGKPLWTSTNASRAWSLAFSPDESKLACSHFHGRVSLWDMASGRQIHTFEGHQAWVHTVAFHPSGQYLASAGSDTQVCIWDLQENKLSRVLKGPTVRVWSLSFSADGQMLGASGDEENIYVWDFKSGGLQQVLRHSSNGQVRIAFHPHLDWLAICCEQDPQINLWDVHSGEILASVTCRSNNPAAIAFSPEGAFLACGGRDGSVELWHLNNERQLQFIKMLMGHQHYISVIAFSQHNLLATLSYGEDIRLWNIENGKLLRVVEGYSRLIGVNAFSPDGRLLLQGDASGKIRLWDMLSHRYTTMFQGHTGPVWALEFSPDGKTFASAGDDRTIRLWDTVSLNCVKTFSGHAGQIWCLAYNHDGSILASGGSPHGIKLWDPSLEIGTLELAHLDTSDDVWSMVFDKRNRYLVSGHTNGIINVWDLASCQNVMSFQNGSIAIGALRFCSDGKTVIASCNQFLMKFWDLETRECVRTVPAELEGNRTRAVAIGADGKIIATGSGGQNLYLWKSASLANQSQPVIIEGHTNRVWGVALSQDERYLASSDEEGTTILSYAQSGTVIEKIQLDRPYERMNVRGIAGLNTAERAALKALGAVENT